ncbi:MAG: 23S ribosomal RNA methyltransferase Erm [bacterium]|nr:23S ribosomal RNA methyltransferase Erm [bacterium]
MFDPAKSLHSKIFAQNFLKDPAIARKLIRASQIAANDTVIEIGPGEGVITRELAQAAGKVIAVESDQKLAAKLKKTFEGQKNVFIAYGDFLNYAIGETTYKVFSNIPFNITNQIVKKLLNAANPPTDTWLFTQNQAAERLASIAREQEFSILTKPWFTYQITYQFNRNDFVPVPKVDVVLLHIHKRQIELLPQSEKEAYAGFVAYGYRQQKKNLAANLEKIFTYEQWKRLAKDLKFPKDVRTSDLAVEAWIGLYRFFASRVEGKKQRLVIR